MELFVLIVLSLFIFIGTRAIIRSGEKHPKGQDSKKNEQKTKIIEERLKAETDLLMTKKFSSNLHIGTDDIKKITGFEKPILELNKRIMQILSKHLRTLWAKQKQRCYTDDYGNKIEAGWIAEKKYFIETVILTDPILNQLQSSIDKSWEYLQNQYKKVVENTKNDLCEYWWNRYKNFIQWIYEKKCLESYKQIVDTSYKAECTEIAKGRGNFHELNLNKYSKICKIFPDTNIDLYCSNFAEYRKLLEEYASYNIAQSNIDLTMIECLDVVENDVEKFISVKDMLMATYKVYRNNNNLYFKYDKTVVLSDLKDWVIYVPYDLMNYNENDLDEEDMEATLSELIDIALIFMADDVGNMETQSKNPLDYEKQIANKLKQLGFNAHATKGSGDQGADVLADKKGVKFAIQCKMYSKPVGNKAVQEANAARDFYKCNYAVVVTNAGYTKSARQAANACDVILLNENQLNKLDNYIE